MPCNLVFFAFPLLVWLFRITKILEIFSIASTKISKVLVALTNVAVLKASKKLVALGGILAVIEFSMVLAEAPVLYY